jgi:ABC-2 type transport system permease protein
MRSPGSLRPGFWLVFWRELGWLRRRPFLLALTTIVPLGLMALLTFVFSAGLATRLPIAVLDLDGSELSRAVIRAVDATPDTAVAVRVSDLAEGRQMILSGRVYGLLMLPLNLERDVGAGRRPEVVFFYNTQTMTPGNLALRGINAAVPAAAAGIRLAVVAGQGQPVEVVQAALSAIPVQTHPLFNPTLNYVHFLLAALLPAVLQTVMVTASAYSIGLDVERRHRLRILRRLGGGIWRAMAGKLLPHAALFLIVLGLADSVLFGVLELPLRGRPAILVAAAILFVLSCQLIGLLLALFLRPMAGAVSIATLLTAPAFGFMGISFPRIAMSWFAYAWGAALPGTWYLMARIDQTIRGTPIALSWRPVLVLMCFVAGLSSFAVLQLQRIRERAGPSPRELRPPRGRTLSEVAR